MSKNSDLLQSIIAHSEKQQEQISALLEQVEVIPVLLKRIENLEQELAIYKNKKNSGNSHIPPSSSLNTPKRNQSLREKSGKKAGGQPGHEGSSLSFSSLPDKIVTHVPQYCCYCGDDLQDVSSVPLNQRQVIDIPVPAVSCTEHQTFAKTCPCGMINKGEFPEGVTSNVQYGSRIEALTAYLNVRQYMPYGRIQEFFGQIMGLKISQGGIVGLMDRFTEKSLPMYQEIKNRIQQATVVGTDETGAKVNGKKHWFWTWQNQSLTFIVQSSSRGYQTIQNTFPLGLPNSVLIHDRWATHFQCPAQDRQICLAHLLRDLNYIHQVHKSKWALSFKQLIKNAMALDNEPAYNGLHLSFARNKLEGWLADLLSQQLPVKHKLAITLQKKLRKISQNILCFLHYNSIPCDNNGSERAIRNIKVKQKISGGFRSTQGADGFAVIRSVIDTVIKSEQNVFYALSLIANLGAPE